jgi:hypothetical protein
MAATATIVQIYCVKEATGTDLGAINLALSGLWPVLPGGFDPESIKNMVRSVFGLADAIDRARSDPDQLYVTTHTAGGLDNSIWPGGGVYHPIEQGQHVFPNITVPIAHWGENISLWDYDEISADDLLGSIAMFEAEKGFNEITKLGRSLVEGSAYYVTYRVD